MKRLNSPVELRNLRKNISKNKKTETITISISSGTCGEARGSHSIIQAFKEEISKLPTKTRKKVSIRITGCHGFCEAEPNVIIYPKGIFYQKLLPANAKEIVKNTVLNREIIDRFLYVDTSKKKKIVYEKEIPFYKKQQRFLLGRNSLIDPKNLNDYLGNSGYKALSTTLRNPSNKIITAIKQSGLRGRGGAGFPTGVKWEICSKAPGDERYVICNADEGDPGAYMDRALLEGNPHSVIEGMIIGAYAIQAHEGYIYVRNEYPLAVMNVTLAIEQAKKCGLLGRNILGSKFNFDIKIVKGAGAFVCGEETALIASIEGKRGTPKQRPPFPVEKGLFRKPTNINNVETWANVPLIIEKGSNWFSKVGTKTSKGTKIFSLVGKIKNTGLVEVPMGITLKEIIYDIGGGIVDGKRFKAIQTGGPSGGCIPKDLLNLPVDYESLSRAGSIMGSGGMIVMDESTCMVDIAKYFLNFLKEESCGKCLSCRKGIQRMHELVTDITEGRGKEEDIELLEELAQTVKDTSMCALGQTAPNPVLSTLKYFRKEYIQHIKDKKCTAGMCKALIHYSILEKKCTGCGLCKKVCTNSAIEGTPKKPHYIVEEKCIKCGVCIDTCKFNSISVE